MNEMNVSEIEIIEILIYEVRVYHEHKQGNYMKSHDLAKKLLSLPDLEVFVETKDNTGTTSDEFHAGQLHDQFTITPSGLFIDYSSMPNQITPSEAPVIGSYMVYFNDGTITPSRLPGQGRWAVPTVKFLANGEVFSVEYGTYNMEKCHCYQVIRMGLEQDIVLSVNDEHFDKLDAVLTEGKRIMRLSDVDHFSVLTDFDKNTWKPVFTEMTYQEALEFGKKL